MSTAQATRPAKQKPWRGRHAFDPTRPTLAGLIGRYLLLIFVVIISIGPFLWQLSTSLKSVNENIYSFPPHLIPRNSLLTRTDALPMWYQFSSMPGIQCLSPRSASSVMSCWRRWPVTH